jgi:hypothetical protein
MRFQPFNTLINIPIPKRLYEALYERSRAVSESFPVHSISWRCGMTMMEGKSYNEMIRSRLREILLKECIKHGKFILSSGGKTTWLCDLMEARQHFPWFMESLAPPLPLAGIMTGGAFLAYAHDPASGVVKLKEGEVYLPSEVDRVSLVDDVTTTGNSFRKAEALLNERGVQVAQYLCVLDRRVVKDFPVRSLFLPEDLGLEV